MAIRSKTGKIIIMHGTIMIVESSFIYPCQLLGVENGMKVYLAKRLSLDK